MKPRDTIRFSCDDCNIVFDPRVAPTSQWAEGPGGRRRQ